MEKRRYGQDVFHSHIPRFADSPTPGLRVSAELGGALELAAASQKE